VYILYSASLDKYYIGFTGDILEERIRKHNSIHKGFTGKAKDWVLKFSQAFKSKQDAISKERDIKNQKSRTYLEVLISSADSEHPA
jgi:putative endonuclease